MGESSYGVRGRRLGIYHGRSIYLGVGILGEGLIGCWVDRREVWDSIGCSVGVAVVSCWLWNSVPAVGWMQCCMAGCQVVDSAAQGNSDGVVLGKSEGVGLSEQGRVVVGGQYTG